MRLTFFQRKTMDNKLISAFAKILERDLGKLEAEINLYAHEILLWKTSGEITNPPGNLCLHLCGNLQHYIGALLGNSGYQRNRPLEFSVKNISKADLLNEIAKTKQAVTETLAKLSDDVLNDLYPEETLGFPMTVGFFLIHLTAHFSYHLGQINYHRRLISACSPELQSYH